MKRLEHLLVEAGDNFLDDGRADTAKKLYDDAFWVCDDSDSAFSKIVYGRTSLGNLAVGDHRRSIAIFNESMHLAQDSPTDIAQMLERQGRVFSQIGWQMMAVAAYEQAQQNLLLAPNGEFRGSLLNLIETRLLSAQQNLAGQTDAPPIMNGSLIPNMNGAHRAE